MSDARITRRSGVVLVILALAACSGTQSSLNPHSVEALHLSELFWQFTITCTIVWLLVVAALIGAMWRKPYVGDLPEQDTPEGTRRKTLIVSTLVAVTAIILTLFTFASFYETREFVRAAPDAMTIKVTAQQWWWQVEYQNSDPTQIITGANEIHIPVGRPVKLDLEASDVIHSFWVPNLMGKQDMIPGRKNALTIRAESAGIYRGQCAEFCGLQHAHMAFLVFADPPAVFETWRKHQLASAETPTAPTRLRGLNVFVNGPCAACHAVQGTMAGGQNGPDLTHFASQKTIGAGVLQNTADNLSRWIADPQAVKPGTNMPQVPLSADDRAAVVAYLEGLT